MPMRLRMTPMSNSVATDPATFWRRSVEVLAVELAGRALPARLDGQEGAAPAATAVMSTVSSKTMNPAEPSPLPMAARSLVAHRGVEKDAGDDAGGHAGQDGLDPRPGGGPPPISSITSRSGVPIGTSPTPWRGCSR